MATNIWNIEEYEGDGVSCPITPIDLPWYKKMVLFFFRFGVCPLCVTSSVVYGTVRWMRQRLGWRRAAAPVALAAQGLRGLAEPVAPAAQMLRGD